MTTITIPKNISPKSTDLVAIPRKEYEELLRVRLRRIPEVELTRIQKKKLAQVRANMAKGTYLTIDELEQRLGVAH